MTYIIKHFNTLPGLRVVPLGLLAISLAVWRIWLQHIFSQAGLFSTEAFIFFSIMAGILIGLALLINRYYQRILGSFGTVESDPQVSTRQRGTLILLFLIYLVSTSVDFQNHLPISMFGLSVATTMFLYWWQMERVQIYYIILAPVVAILSLLPLLVKVLHSHLFFYSSSQYWNIIQLIIGLTLILCGVGDHLFLLKALKGCVARRKRETN